MCCLREVWQVSVNWYCMLLLLFMTTHAATCSKGGIWMTTHSATCSKDGILMTTHAVTCSKGGILMTTHAATCSEGGILMTNKSWQISTVRNIKPWPVVAKVWCSWQYLFVMSLPECSTVEEITRVKLEKTWFRTTGKFTLTACIRSAGYFSVYFNPLLLLLLLLNWFRLHNVT